MDLGVAGLASGFDWKALVDQLVEVERTPQKRLRIEQNTLEQHINAYNSIKTELTVLDSRVEALNDPGLFQSRNVNVGDSSILSATASPGTPLGSYALHVTQLASASTQSGTDNMGAGLNSDNDVSGLVLRDANFTTAITAGTFTVNGSMIQLETTDTLQGVFDKISTATGGAVTGGYDAATDKITFSGAGEIVLGSAADSSNFLQVARLSNNGTNSVSSSTSLGAIQVSNSLATANFATAIDDGGAGAGLFKINGVEIQYDASTDTVSDVLDRINSSEAGVNATYDNTKDRFVMTNRTTGDLGFAFEDVTGNFLAASGVTTGTLARGHNLEYTINNGETLTSRTNAITSDSSGIQGLAINVFQTGSSSIEIGSDIDKIKETIDSFLAAYNKVQSLISNETTSTTDAKGKVTAGLLAGDDTAEGIADKLRSQVYGQITGLSGTITYIADLGIDTNGYDNTLTLEDSDKLDAALRDNLNSVSSFFTDATSGLAAQLATYLENTIGDDGTLNDKTSHLGEQIGDITGQIADLERLVQANEQNMINRFVAMETTQQRMNQQLQFLLQNIGGAG